MQRKIRFVPFSCNGEIKDNEWWNKNIDCESILQLKVFQRIIFCSCRSILEGMIINYDTRRIWIRGLSQTGFGDWKTQLFSEQALTSSTLRNCRPPLYLLHIKSIGEKEKRWKIERTHRGTMWNCSSFFVLAISFPQKGFSFFFFSIHWPHSGLFVTCLIFYEHRAFCFNFSPRRKVMVI